MCDVFIGIGKGYGRCVCDVFIGIGKGDGRCVGDVLIGIDDCVRVPLECKWSGLISDVDVLKCGWIGTLESV